MSGRAGERVSGGSMHVGVLRMELHLEASSSLKAKRAVIRHLIETARRRHGVSASEVAYHDLWQRSALGFAVVAPTSTHAEELLDRVERFVWSHPEVSVVASSRQWVELDELDG
ncbi:MAG TPA: DUF503 domain-containing protein [Acidimicrobiales bacterium]|nr:DUF503 domain-containing protein [Acidimicrobiales bacterium]